MSVLKYVFQDGRCTLIDDLSLICKTKTPRYGDVIQQHLQHHIRNLPKLCSRFFASLAGRSSQLAVPHQSGPAVIAGAARKTPTAQVCDEAGKKQADHAAEQDSGVGPLHHPVKHKCLNTEAEVTQPVWEKPCSRVLRLFTVTKLNVFNLTLVPSNPVLLH